MANLETKNGQIFQQFAVRNPSQSSPSSTILVPVWFNIKYLVFFYPSKLFVGGFLQFEGDFAVRKNNLKYRDIAPYASHVLLATIS